jgi:2-keto-4-pentenoate hydratase
VNDALAGRLWEAWRDGAVLEEPPSALAPGLDLESAYVTQRAIVARRTADGERGIGWKVGLSGAVEPRPSGGPIYGRLLSGMVAAELEPIGTRALHGPEIEAEIAFVMGRRLDGPGVTIADALAATRGVMPALEIIASRWRGEGVPHDFVADNSASAHVVLGGRLVPPGDVDLPLTGMALWHGDGRLLATGAGARVLGHPAQAVAWLANALGAHGEPLEAGDVVLSGSLAPAYPVRPGDTFTAELAGLGRVSARFASRGPLDTHDGTG